MDTRLYTSEVLSPSGNLGVGSWGGVGHAWEEGGRQVVKSRGAAACQSVGGCCVMIA